MQAEGEIVAYFLKDAENRRKRDVRYDILLEIGYLLKGTEEQTWCNVITIGAVKGADRSTAYFATATIGDTEMCVFSAIVHADREIEWLEFVPDHWQRNLRNWYTEARAVDLADRPLLPSVADATGGA